MNKYPLNSPIISYARSCRVIKISIFGIREDSRRFSKLPQIIRLKCSAVLSDSIVNPTLIGGGEYKPNITVCTCFMMISLAMVAGQSRTILFTLSLSKLSSCRINERPSSAVLILRAVCIENIGDPNAS